MTKVGLLCIATNRYLEFALQMLQSADIHFQPSNDVEYFLFTNHAVESATSCIQRKTTVTTIEHKPWPEMTLGRYEIFKQNSALFSECSHLFYCDADMLFVAPVKEEIVGDRVATIHPGYYNSSVSRFTYERNPKSLAHIPVGQGKRYYAGGFQGGNLMEFIKMCSVLSDRINQDRTKGIIAQWHDESHMNKYFNLDALPTVELSPSYCFPDPRPRPIGHGDQFKLPFEPKLLALAKTFAHYNKIRQKYYKLLLSL